MAASKGSASNHGYDYPPYPNSWIQVAWSHELRPGQVRSLACFGRQLVLYRGMDGQARILDAYCPHLGAHLGIGGKVVDNDIQCPFHGWQFDGGGVCTRIPFAQKIPPKARLSSWPVCEANGLIFVWHDAKGLPPWFEVPILPEYGSPDWSEIIPHQWTLRTRWREPLENAVDRAHFHMVHRHPEPPSMELHTDGPHFTVRAVTMLRAMGKSFETVIDLEAFGAGLGITRTGAPLFPFVLMGSALPIDPETVSYRLSLMVSRSKPFRLPFPLQALVRQLMSYFNQKEFEKDIPIWENKIPLRRPLLSDADGPIARFRSWSRQFYDAEESALIHSETA